MNSFDILSESTVLCPRLFLEASAGTGKTFTIEHLVVRLLLETPMNLEEIVVVTFTRAATRELKDRIRSNLEEIIQKKVSFPYLQNITSAQLRKIEDALYSFDQAQIFTIHGFCLHLLKQFAFEAGISLDLTEWSREEELWEIKQFLRTQTALSFGELQRLLSTYRYDISRLENALISSSGEANINEIPIPSLKGFKPFSLVEEFEQIRSSYKGMTSAEYTLQAEQLQQALTAGEISPSLWNEWVAKPGFFLKNLEDTNLKVRAKCSCSPSLAKLRDQIAPLLEEAQNPSRIFTSLSSAWHKHRTSISEREGKITPDDLLKIVHSTLSIPSFIEAVRKKYRAAIVDEFQDTDPLQWEIFKTLFIEDSSKSVYLVGDPKQSIYAFRSADIYTFLEAAKSFGIEQKASLTRNYRSSSGLLERINQLLCAGIWMDLPKQNRFLPVPLALPAKEGDGKLCFMIAQGEKGRSSRFPTQEMEDNQFLPFIAYEIIHKHLKPTSTTILVKDRFQADRVKRYLLKCSIPASLYRSSPLSQSPVIEYLEEMIDATLTLSTSSIKKMLLGPFAAIPFHLLSQDVVYQAKKHLQILRELWLFDDFSSFFAEFLNTSFGEKTALTSFYLHTDHLNDLLEISQKILFAESPYHLKELLAAIKIYDTEDRISSHANGIQIMTTHASKGLEFENVFALGLASRTPSSSKEEHPEEKLIELDAEKMRQFYVAVTRAAKRLYIPIAQELPTPSYEIGEGSPVELFLAKAKPDFTSFEHVFLHENTYNLEPVIQPENTILSLPLSLQKPFPMRFMQSFTSLAQETPTIAKGENQGIDAGKETGILIHRILERFFNQEGSLVDLTREETQRTKLAGKEEQIIQMLTQALKMSLGSFALCDIPFSSVQTEVEFLYKTAQGWMRGYIDLYVEHEGKAYVIDWKTNLLENTHPETIEALMKSHDYYLQGKIYKEAVQKYTSLPIGGVYFIFIRGPAFYV